MSLMETFINPDTMHNLSIGDKIIGGLITTLMGIGMTFIILLLLWVVITLVSKLISKTEKKPKEATVKVEAKPVEAVKNDDELVAVIMAAIAASQGADAITNLQVKRINRISGNAPAWMQAGRGECIDSRRI